MYAFCGHPELEWKLIIGTVRVLLLLGLLLFAAAGTVSWPAAWVYLALVAASNFGRGFWLARHDPTLLRERLSPLIQPGQKPWDKWLMMLTLALWVGWLVLIGLDARRFHWSAVPLGVQIVGFVLTSLGSYLIWLTFKTNSYASPTIKIQKDREHEVITTGPYAFVRHPMYAGIFCSYWGDTLLLGSWWALFVAAVLVVLLGIRVVLEERTLKAELHGYSDYTKRVPYRLVPLVW